MSVKDEVVNPSRYDIEYYLNDWLTYEKAMNLLKFENDKNILKSAHEFLNDNNYI